MADRPNNPAIAPDPLDPDPRRDLTPEEQAELRGDPWGPQELGTDAAAGGADSSPLDNTSPADRHQPDTTRPPGGERRNS